MKPLSLTLFTTLIATPLIAEEGHREMEAHVHGVSSLELAVEDNQLEMNLYSPGMDIVGFEYEPASSEDKTAVAKALQAMATPTNIVTLPDEAACHLSEVLAHRHSDEHKHDDDEGHEHARDEGHGDHAHEHEHEHEAEGDVHSSFHVRYKFDCDNASALTKISFPFFEKFENAKEIEAKYVTEKGAGSAEINRSAPELTLN